MLKNLTSFITCEAYRFFFKYYMHKTFLRKEQVSKKKTSRNSYTLKVYAEIFLIHFTQSKIFSVPCRHVVIIPILRMQLASCPYRS